jgi:hypothetical protein
MQLLSEERSIHAKAVCESDSLEETRVPAAPFGAFDERVALLTQGCSNNVASFAGQYSTMTGDTLWVETSVVADAVNEGRFESHSDINVRFRIPPGQQCRGISQISFDSDNRGGGYVILNAKFQKVTPTRTVTIDSVALRHETFGIVGDTLYRDQTLKAGDYVLDLHLLAGPTRTGSDVVLRVFAGVVLSDPTPVAPVTWTHVKGLYR